MEGKLSWVELHSCSIHAMLFRLIYEIVHEGTRVLERWSCFWCCEAAQVHWCEKNCTFWSAWLHWRILLMCTLLVYESMSWKWNLYILLETLLGWENMENLQQCQTCIETRISCREKVILKRQNNNFQIFNNYPKARNRLNLQCKQHSLTHTHILPYNFSVSVSCLPSRSDNILSSSTDKQ